MSLRTTPHGREYTEKVALWKEVLKTTIDTIKDADAKQAIELLAKYKDMIPGQTKQDTNSFEMIALYQRSIQLLWDGKNPSVDALFWPATFEQLKKIQSEKLGLSWKDVDGLPGPITTNAIIKAFEKSPGIQTTQPDSIKNGKSSWGSPLETGESLVQAESWAEVVQLTPAEKADKFLKAEGFTKNEKWEYIGPDKDLTLVIKNWVVEFTRSLGRVFGSWELSDAEKRITLEVAKLFSITNK